MRHRMETQAETEIIHLFSDQPSPERIIAFHPPPEVTERFYELVDTERERALTDDERAKLETYLSLEHLLQKLKIEAHHKHLG